jgi:hypothetical protein
MGFQQFGLAWFSVLGWCDGLPVRVSAGTTTKSMVYHTASLTIENVISCRSHLSKYFVVKVREDDVVAQILQR